MPSEAGSPEAIKCFENDEGMSFQLTKFRTCNDVDPFLCLSFKIGIADIGGPKVEVIELG